MKSIVFYWLPFALFISCVKPKTNLFELRKDLGVLFENKLTYTQDFNPYTYRNFYNGAGVALGDINNDGLLDIYMTGNLVDNKLLINKGDWKFEDITERAGVACKGVWSTGVTFADINGDDLLDIYVCKSGKPGGENRHNELFINQGDLTFKEESEKYGLDVLGLSVHAAFFDADLDGDLDCYVLNNSLRSVGGYDLIKDQRLNPDPNGEGNKFFENKEGVYIDVSAEKGIYTSSIGFGLGITLSDFNDDKRPDLYISNDFFERDYFYLNNKEGFEEVLESQFQSISMGAMGADAADLNNDLLPDLFVTEMLPSNLKRQKLKAKYDSWDKYSLMNNKGYFHQYPRNSLQRNTGQNQFFEISRFSGVAATEWSWASLIFDMDNDGLNDIFVANGIYKDLLDRDYLAYMANETQVQMLLENREDAIEKLIDIMPSEAVPNSAFKNIGEFQFEDKTIGWGLEQPSFSNGNAYGDLDNDGDLDLVVNNVNMPAFIYKNTTDTLVNRSFQLTLKAFGNNTKAVGTKVTLYTGQETMVSELYPSRGFQSTVPHRLHFGLGNVMQVDSIMITWPDGKQAQQYNLPTNQLIQIEQKHGLYAVKEKEEALKETPSPFQYTHKENKFIEFNRERLLTQMNHNEGPALAVADINKDGIDDVFIGGGKGQAAALYLSDVNGVYQSMVAPFEKDKESEDTHAIWVDIDQDQDLDLVVASGGRAFSVYSQDLNDRIYENKGNGVLQKVDSPWISDRKFSSKALAAADVNRDGKIDLFVGERYSTFTYGIPTDGFLMINQGEGKFKQQAQRSLEKIGMITDAAFTDLNGDEWPDLVLVGEWMPITVLMNQNGTFVNKTKEYGLEETVGLWNVLRLEDLNDDGKMDLIAGNHGTNTFLEPNMKMFINDFDKNGSLEQILCVKRNQKYYPVIDKDELITQLPSLKKKIVYYADYAEKDITQILDPLQVNAAYSPSLNQLKSQIFIRSGESFKTQDLPEEIQYAPVYAISPISIDKNGQKSLYLGGNQYLVKPQFGRYDASKAWRFSFVNEAGEFKFETPISLGIEGQIRGILPIKINNNNIYIFAINDDEVRFYKWD